jgi:hypothetical protein
VLPSRVWDKNKKGSGMKKFWRIAGWSGLVLAVIVGYAAYRTIWGKPFTLNMLANRQAIEFLIENPELFSQVGLVDGTISDRHSNKRAARDILERAAAIRPRQARSAGPDHL